jgi:hypothetical protein
MKEGNASKRNPLFEKQFDFGQCIAVFGLPLRIFDKLATTVATFVVLFSPTSHTIFHHI